MTRPRRLVVTILLLTSGAALATEEPRYTVVRTEATFEVRRYEPYLVAETLVAGSADEAGSQRLQDALAGAGLTWRGEPVWARYDAPWTPWFLRRNEIWLELQ